MSTYREFRFYSFAHDGEAVRLSMMDERQEYYAVVPAEGRGWRDRRDAALDAIEAAIRRRDEPGEVILR